MTGRARRSGRVRGLRLLGSIAVVALVAAGCDSDDEAADTPDPAEGTATTAAGDDNGERVAADGVTVVAKGIAFDTDAIRLAAGEAATITLDNQDPEVSHSLQITAGDEVFTTGIFEGPAEQSVEVVITEAGTYPFVCEVHSFMEGEVVVE